MASLAAIRRPSPGGMQRGLPGPDPGYYILALIVPAVYPVVYVACKCVLHEGLMSSQHSAVRAMRCFGGGPLRQEKEGAAERWLM